MWTCALLAILSTGAQAWAGPPAEEFGELKEQLNKPIDVNFLQTPVGTVLEEVCKDAGVNLVLPNPSEVEGAGKVTLRLKQAPVYRILNIVTAQSDLDWQVIDGVLSVDSAAAIRRQRAVIRIYDIASIVQIHPNFTASPLALDASSWRDDEMKGGGSSLFGDTSENVDIRAEVTTMLIHGVMELIRDSVGDPLEWADRGGEVSSLRELHGQLIIRATPEDHVKIQKLLNDLRARIGRMVAVEMIVAYVPTEQIEHIMEATRRSPVLNPEQAARLWNVMTELDKGRVAVARNVCYNGQRVYLGATRGQCAVAVAEPQAFDLRTMAS